MGEVGVKRCDCDGEGKWWLGEHRPGRDPRLPDDGTRPACPQWVPANREVSKWAIRAREATTLRDEAIRRMRSEGVSLRLIAESAGLSHSAIARILDRTPV